MPSSRPYPAAIVPTIGRRHPVLIFLMVLGLLLALGWFVNGLNIEPTSAIEQQARYNLDRGDPTAH